jgi:hypothetical protein|tara:strand:- start:51 stop:464 length:414 start_codon:yes stop_codon:yes gene_type:complete
MNPKFLDKNIYKKAKKIADSTYEKNSAYKSLFMISKYKELGGKIDEKKSSMGTEIWLKEKWKNLTPYATNEIKKINDLPVCGTRTKKQIKEKLPSICRPTKKVNSKTVKLAQDYTKKQIKKALKIKVNKKRIDWSEL